MLLNSCCYILFFYTSTTSTKSYYYIPTTTCLHVAVKYYIQYPVTCKSCPTSHSATILKNSILRILASVAKVELSQTMTSKEQAGNSNIGSGSSRNIHPTNLRFSTNRPQKF